MRRVVVSTAAALTAAFLTAGVWAQRQAPDLPAPITNSPAARQTASSATADRADATARLSPTSGNTASGELRLVSEEAGVRVLGTVTGLTPNSTHGIHIHETGDCSAEDASSAGEHFSPLGEPHGAPGPDTHVGDLGNITANHAGIAYVDVSAPGAMLDGTAATSISGRAVIVHAKADDLRSQPSGNSGARIACGVITSSQRR